MSGLHADTGAMNNNGKQTVANAESFSQELASLKSNIASLMSIWSGPAASEFNKSYEAQDQNLQAFQQLLNELGESISKAANHLNNNEEDNANRGSHLFG